VIALHHRLNLLLSLCLGLPFFFPFCCWAFQGVCSFSMWLSLCNPDCTFRDSIEFIRTSSVCCMQASLNQWASEPTWLHLYMVLPYFIPTFAVQLVVLVSGSVLNVPIELYNEKESR
jgi:hypothetical protein